LFRKEANSRLFADFLGKIWRILTIFMSSTLDKILKIGDKATRTTALMTLYNEMKDKPADIDLQSMWKRLGVRLDGRRIVFDNGAPQAKLRHNLIFGR